MVKDIFRLAGVPFRAIGVGICVFVMCGAALLDPNFVDTLSDFWYGGRAKKVVLGY